MGQTIRFSYRNAPTLRAFADSDAFVRGLMGPVGGGKSSACVVEIIARGMAQQPAPDGVRRSRWACVRNTFGELHDTTIKTFHAWVPQPEFGNWHATNHEYTITAFPGVTIEVLFRALDRPDHVKKLLSLDLTGAWVNEAREVPWGIIEMLQSRVGRYPPMRDGGPTWAGLFMDTNAPEADSRWFRFFEEEDHTDEIAALATFVPGLTAATYAAVFKQPSGLGPTAENLPNLQAGYYQRLAIGKSPEWVKVYLRGEYGFVMDGLPVFPEYSDAMHLGDCKTIPGVPVYRGWDFGLTPACVYSQMSPTGRWCVVDELTSERAGADRFSDIVLEHSAASYPGREFRDVGDPAGNSGAETDEKTCFEILRAKGIEIEPAPQVLEIRLESMRKPLTRLVDGKPQFVLHPRCQTLRKGFLGGYQYKRLRVSGERYTAVPDKNRFSHPMDGLTYTAAVIFGAGLTRALPSADFGDRDDLMFSTDQTRSPVTGY